jgi:uncharacterized protein
MSEYSETAQLLLEKGLNVHDKNKDGDTVRILACRNGHGQTAEDLLWKNDADVNDRKFESCTPLHAAVVSKCNSVELVSLLFQQGANLNAKNKQGILIFFPLHPADLTKSRQCC